MTALDLAVMTAYMMAMFTLGLVLSRSQRSAEDHFVGGRSLPWWALAISTLATQSSATSFIGIPAFVALVPGGGMTWLQYELALPVALLIVLVVFVPVLRGLRVVSVYEYLELRFDRTTCVLLSAVFLLSRAAATGVALYAAALVVHVCTGLSVPASVLLMGGATLLYDSLGGMRAVVWSDVLQMALLLAGIVVCTALALEIAGGWAQVLASTEPQRLATLELAHGIGDGARAPMWGFVVGGLVLYVAYYGVDQSQVQRQLSARSVCDAQRLLVANALVRFPLTLAYVGMGLALGAAYAASEPLQASIAQGRWDMLVPRFVEQHLPAGVRGVVVVALMAAAMSSLDSALNSLSAATMRDFLPQGAQCATSLRVARWVTVCWGVVITAIGWVASEFTTSVIEGINRVGALFYGPLLAAFACGILDCRATGVGVRAGVVAGLATNLVLWWTMQASVFWMWWNVSGLLTAAFVCALVSRRRAPSVTPAALSDAGPWADEARRSLRRWGGLLMAYTGAIVAVMLWLQGAGRAGA